ncbi:hypothetical protein LSAT2_028353, partial [Lamellibrachia satsuma]
MRSVYFHRVSADPDSDQEEEKMAFNVARLLNSDESDRAQIDSLVEEYFLEDLTDGSEEDEDANFANYETDENDDFDFRQNDYDTAMEVANRSVETVSDSPDEELRKAKKFRCSCKYNKGGPCYTIFGPQQLVERRLMMADFTPREQMEEKSVEQKVRKHQRTRYFLEGHQLCRDTFKFIHDISQNRLSSLLSWYKDNGLVAKEKLTGGRKSNVRAHTFEDTKRAVSFICSYAEDNALVLPGRIPGYKRDDVKLLPSSETKTKVYECYKSACEQKDHAVMSMSVFRTTWLNLVPHILTARPMTDLCWTCQSNNHMIYRGVNLIEEEKSQRLKKQE